MVVDCRFLYIHFQCTLPHAKTLYLSLSAATFTLHLCSIVFTVSSAFSHKSWVSTRQKPLVNCLNPFTLCYYAFLVSDLESQ